MDIHKKDNLENSQSKEKEQRYKIWIPLLFALAAIIGLAGGYKMAGKDTLSSLIVNSRESEGVSAGRVEELVRFIESRYVSDLNSDELIEDAFQNVMEHLDPHSIYLKPEDLKQLNQQMGGSFEGIGIESIFINDTLYINHVISDGPAFEAGLHSGDRIIAINDSIIIGQAYSFARIRDMLKGTKGEEIKLLIDPYLDDVEKEITLRIGNVDVKSVRGFRYKDDFAVLKIDRFSSDSYREFMNCLARLDEEGGFNNLILDLRGNPGGFLPEATRMLNQIFQEKGRLMVYTQGRQERVSEYKTTGKAFYPIDKVAILVDEGSASGSEIIAGAIQDWDRGLIVGRRTFGKGLVQEQYNLSNGGALRLTVAEYFTPSGRLIQKAFDDRDIYNDDIADRIASGELTGDIDMPILDTTEYKTKIIKRPVYAAGGISPDIYIPIDSLELSSEVLQATAYIDEFVFKKFMKNEFGIPEQEHEFLNNWVPTPELVSEFRRYVNFENNDYDWISSYIEPMLKEEVAKIYFGTNAALKVSFENDAFLEQSLQGLSKTNIFAHLNQ